MVAFIEKTLIVALNPQLIEKIGEEIYRKTLQNHQIHQNSSYILLLERIQAISVLFSSNLAFFHTLY